MNYEFTKSTINKMREGHGKEFFKKAYASKHKSRALKVKKEEGTKFSKEVKDTPYGKIAFLKGETLNKARRGRFGEAGAINNSIWRKTHRMRQKSGEAGKWIPYRRD